MKRLLILILLFATTTFVYAQIATDIYWVQFTDKANSPYSINNPEAYLSPKALQRRANQGIAIDEYDIPVNPQYLQAVSNCGALLLNPSKWLNGVSIYATNSSVVEAINALDFVSIVRNCPNDPYAQLLKEQRIANEMKPLETIIKSRGLYGGAEEQVTQLKVNELHDMGFDGSGIIIAVFDGGFQGTPDQSCFDNMREEGRLLGTKEFVFGQTSVYSQITHGTSCLSAMAAFDPNNMVGTAPKASYYLIHTEDSDNENIIEEYNWVSAAEFADSLGVDVCSTSLNYIDFDMTQWNHPFEHFDGMTTPMSIGAEIAVSRGIICINAAGNEGDGTCTIGIPADAEHVLTVGAVDASGNRASFSSVGPTYDGRIKPDVMAMGENTYVASGYGSMWPYYNGSGTSFATPVLAGATACLRQANPYASVQQICDIIRSCGDHANNPDNYYGYGIPNFSQALNIVINNYTITATASPSNAGTITGAGSYASGSTCTLRATPNSGYTFVNWLENGTSVSTNATYSFTVTGNRNLVAVFDVAPTNYTITATANPSNGGSVDGGGTYASGSTCTLRATANSGYTFVNWTKNGTQVSTNPNYSFTVTGNASYVANFEPIPEEYTITVNADPANGGTVSGGGTYAEGSTCVISAMPNEGYVFENWTRNGTVVSTEPTYSIVVNRNLTFVAHFAQNANQATITAMAEPIEGGSVSGGGTYESDSNCTLNAVAAVGYEFVNWTLNGSQVSTEASFSFTVTGNAVYVAHFSKTVNHYTVSTNVQPANAGSVIGAGIYEEGTSCTLIAMANPTYTFVSWTENGAVVSTDEQYTFSVERDRNLVAVFSQGQFYTITASAGGNGSITPEGEIMVNPGEDKTFAIIPNSGCRVSKVLVDGVDVGPVESYTFRSVNANHSIRAQFSGLGVDDNPMHELKVYPNPANDKINIECPNMKRISVFNLYGVQIEIMDVNDDHAVFSTDNLSQGTYILKVESQEGRIDYTRFILIK